MLYRCAMPSSTLELFANAVCIAEGSLVCGALGPELCAFQRQGCMAVVCGGELGGKGRCVVLQGCDLLLVSVLCLSLWPRDRLDPWFVCSAYLLGPQRVDLLVERGERGVF